MTALGPGRAVSLAAAAALGFGMLLSACAALADTAAIAAAMDAFRAPRATPDLELTARVQGFGDAKATLSFLALAPLLLGSIGLAVAGAWGWRDPPARRGLVGMQVALLALIVSGPLHFLWRANGPLVPAAQDAALLVVVAAGVGWVVATRPATRALVAIALVALATRVWIAQGMRPWMEPTDILPPAGWMVALSAVAWLLLAAAYGAHIAQPWLAQPRGAQPTHGG